MTHWLKAIGKIDSLVNKAKKERDHKGYRENLGYDQQNKFEDYLSTLDLTYQQRAKLIGHFYAKCGEI